MTIQPQLTIRPATTADLPAIMKLIESAIEIMHNNGKPDNGRTAIQAKTSSWTTSLPAPATFFSRTASL